jgi:uncharacterized protein
MAMTNYERVGKGLELLRDGLRPYVERELQARYGERWGAQAAQWIRQERSWTAEEGDAHFDVHAILFFLFRRYIVKGLTFGAVSG